MPTDVPLAVDLDGTLLRTDTLAESVLCRLRAQPWIALLLPLWLLRGRPYLKARLAERGVLDVVHLPLTEDLVEFLRAEKARGRKIILATAAHRSIAERIRERLPIFDEIFATDGNVNLAGGKKALALRAAYGDKGFAYAGNEYRDLRVWRHASAAVVVNAPASLLAAVRRIVPVEAVFGPPRKPARSLLRAMRPHQWLKNLLILLPVMTAHRLGDATVLGPAFVGFVSFSCGSSAIYLLNDLLDLAADRVHARKRARPLAAGDLALSAAAAAVPFLLAAAAACAAFLPPLFGALLLVYVAAASFYSLFLKRLPGVDVLTLAGLYVLRILAGHAATGLAHSFWLLLLALFFFLSLALVKRYAELRHLPAGDTRTLPGRGYAAADAPVIAMFGTASGCLSVLVLGLYINSDAVLRLYTHPQLLWMQPFLLLLWLMRVWMKAHRGELHEDPVIFTATDVVSWALGALIAGVMWIAI